MRLQSMEGWRGLAALFVVIYHVDIAHIFFHQPWLRNGVPILELFFVISGFVLALGFRDRIRDERGFWSFIVRRFGRIWPLHLAMLGLLLLLPLMRMFVGNGGEVWSSNLEAGTLPIHALLLQTWGQGESWTDWNFPAWTLSAEIVAYVVMAVIVLISPNAKMRWLLSIATIIAAGTVFQIELAESPIFNVPTIARCLTGFFVGFLLFDVWQRYPIKTARTAAILEITAVVFAISVLFFRFYGPAYFTYHAAAAFLVYVFAFDRGPISKALTNKPLLWLGSRSFSIYIFHGVVLVWARQIGYFIERVRGEPLWSPVTTVWGENEKYIDLGNAWLNNGLFLAFMIVVLAGAEIMFRT
ncbi:MAG: acyltransferase, partial [Caulobacterales bacterium]